MSARGLLQHEIRSLRDERAGLQRDLDAAHAELRTLRDRLATTDRARVQALADLTAAEMHLDAARLPIPSLPTSPIPGAEWAARIERAARVLSGALAFRDIHGESPDSDALAAEMDALVREWPARRARLLGEE